MAYNDNFCGTSSFVRLLQLNLLTRKVTWSSEVGVTYYLVVATPQGSLAGSMTLDIQAGWRTKFKILFTEIESVTENDVCWYAASIDIPSAVSASTVDCESISDGCYNISRKGSNLIYSVINY